MDYKKHYKYFPEIVKFWVNEYMHSMKSDVKSFPDKYRDYSIENITYDEDIPYTYYIHIKEIDKNWVLLLDLNSVKYSPELAKYIIEVTFSTQYLPTINKVRYSEAHRDLRFVTYISYKLNKDFTISNLAITGNIESGYPGELYYIIDLIVKDPWTAIYLSTYPYGVYGEYKDNVQMRKEAKKYVKDSLRNRKLEYEINIKLANYTVKILEKSLKNTEWSSDKVPDNFDWNGIENSFFAVWDNGENVSPRFDIVFVNDKLVEVYHEEDKVLDLKPRDIYCISITDEEDNKIDSYYNKLKKKYKNIFVWRAYSIYVCTSNYYTNHYHKLKEHSIESLDDNKILDWKYIEE